MSLVASERCYVASLDLDFELKRSSDPLAKIGRHKKIQRNIVNILEAPITKLK